MSGTEENDRGASGRDAFCLCFDVRRPLSRLGIAHASMALLSLLHRFLNTDGGWLIFGVAPKSLKILGQQVSDDTQREIAQALAGMTVPDKPTSPNQKYYLTELGKELLKTESVGQQAEVSLFPI